MAGSCSGLCPEWVAFDLETTGLDPVTDRIVEIGAVRFDAHGAVLGEFSSLVNPRRPVSPGAFAVHGLGAAELRDSPSAETVLPAFLGWLAVVPAAGMIAHNARFDASFLACELERTALPAPELRVHDTLALSRRMLPGLRDHRLATLELSLGLGGQACHRALADSHVVRLLWLRLGGTHHTTAYPLIHRVDHATPPSGWDRLSSALERGWTVRMVYEGGTRGCAPREITPRRFLHMGGTAYLVALCHCDRHEKKFRLDRIVSYELIAPVGVGDGSA